MMLEDKIKDIIIEGYRKILKREPDPDGLRNYIQEFKNGLSSERFYETLKSSDEYRERFNPQNAITYCMIGYNKLHEIKPYIGTILSYIDRFIFIDGGSGGYSTDGTIEYLRSLNSNDDNKIEIYMHEWKEDFSVHRNYYLKHFTEKQNSGWILTSDTDEYFPIEIMSKLKDEIKAAESEGYNGIEIRSYDMIVDHNDPNNILHQELSNSWKPLLFKYRPDIHYERGLHEILQGPIKWKQSNLIYRHIRSPRKMYERAVQNFWISNSNKYSDKWKEFRQMCNNNNMTTFVKFKEIYNKGELPKNIENWIYDHKDDNDCVEDSEIREMAKLYYEILHPNKRLNK